MSDARILVLRPEPGASATVAKLRGLGLDPTAMPLFAVAPLPWSAPDAAGYDALALSSANALRHGGDELLKLRHLPVYAVGETTAQAARAAGFSVAATGSGGIGGLESLLRRDGRRAILRLVGRDYIEFAPADMRVDTIGVYAARDVAVDPASLAALPDRSVALLYSVRAAERFRGLVEQAGLSRGRFRLAAISPAVADAAGGGWAGSVAAAEASEASLLSALQNMLEADAQAGRQGRQ